MTKSVIGWLMFALLILAAGEAVLINLLAHDLRRFHLISDSGADDETKIPHATPSDPDADDGYIKVWPPDTDPGDAVCGAYGTVICYIRM